MTEIVVFSETAAVEWQADALWHICASGQLVSISSLPDRNCSKQSHYTTLQGLPLYLCNGFCFSLLHDLGLLVTFLELTVFIADQERCPKQSVLQLHSSHLLSENFHAFEGCNHVASWSLFLSLNNYSPFNLPLLTLDHAFCSPPDILQSLHMFLDSGTQNLIQALIWASLLFICLPSWQILGQVMTLVFNSWHLKH